MKDFEKIYGQEIRPYVPEKAGAFTMLNTFNDMKENPVVKQIMDGMKAGMLQGRDENDPEMIFTLSIVFNTPLVRLVQQGGGATPLGLMQAAVACANGDMSAVEQLSAMMGGK
jgi:beta-glucosidase